MREPAPPTLILVTGRPGAGKSTLAPALAAAVRCPLVSRDAIKEGMMLAADEPDARVVNDAFFDAIALLLGRGVSLVAEAAFQHVLWSLHFEALATPARVRMIVLDVDAAVARARRAARAASDPSRERFHPAVAHDAYESPRLPAPTLTVDARDGYRPAFEAIVAFARGDATP